MVNLEWHSHCESLAWACFICIFSITMKLRWKVVLSHHLIKWSLQNSAHDTAYCCCGMSKLCRDLTTRTGITANWIFHQIKVMVNFYGKNHLWNGPQMQGCQVLLNFSILLLKLHFCYWNFPEILAKILKFVIIYQLFLHKNTEICVISFKNPEIIAICYWSEFPEVGSPADVNRKYEVIVRW